MSSISLSLSPLSLLLLTKITVYAGASYVQYIWPLLRLLGLQGACCGARTHNPPPTHTNTIPRTNQTQYERLAQLQSRERRALTSRQVRRDHNEGQLKAAQDFGKTPFFMSRAEQKKAVAKREYKRLREEKGVAGVKRAVEKRRRRVAAKQHTAIPRNVGE